jgi:hypothetical protein
MQEIIEALKVLAPVVSILIAASAIMQNVERGRRELAVSLIYNWAKDTDWATSRAITLAKVLPRPIVDKICQKNGVNIPIEFYEGLVSVLRGGFPEHEIPLKPDSTGNEFQITPEQSAFIRFLWIRWLNRLEGTLAAWQQGAADPFLMDCEFAPLVQGSEAELEVFTQLVKGLPVLDEFYKQQKAKSGLKVKRKLGIFPWYR